MTRASAAAARWLMLLLAAMVYMATASEAEELEKEPKVSSLNMGVALMLLGSIGFIMALCYLMFHPDKDIRLYAWKVICATISIFVAVLLFQAFEGLLEYWGFKGSTFGEEVALKFGMNLMWFTILQVFLAWVSRIWSIRGERALPVDEGELEEVMEKMELDMKCWATLLGHITGFSSIHAWCTLQQAFDDSLMGSFLVIPVATIALWGLHRGTDYVRETIAAMDGRKDPNEALWDEEVEETMEDVIGLTLSFLMVQFLRFAIGGRLPNVEGDVPYGKDLDSTGGAILTLAGLVSAGLAFMRVLSGRAEENFLEEMMTLVAQFIFAWCVMFNVDAILERHGMAEEGDALGNVCAALIITAVSFAFIRVLDIIADANASHHALHKTITGCVTTLGVLIGFSWEKCFDIAVDDIAIEVHKGHGFDVAIPAAFTKMVLAVALALFVIPAWRFYILPIVFSMGGFAKEQERDIEGGDRAMQRVNTNLGNLLDKQEEKRREAKRQAALALMQEATGYSVPLLGDVSQTASGNQDQHRSDVDAESLLTDLKEHQQRLADSEKRAQEQQQKLSDLERHMQDLRDQNRRELEQLEDMCQAQASKAEKAQAELLQVKAEAAAAAAAPSAQASGTESDLQVAMGKIQGLKAESAQFQEMLALAMQQREEAIQERDLAFKKWDEMSAQVDEAYFQQGDAQEKLEKAVKESADAVQEREEAMRLLEDVGRERDVAVEQRDEAMAQLGSAAQQRDEAMLQLTESMQASEVIDATRKQAEANRAIDLGRLEAQESRIRGLEAELMSAQVERDELASRVEVLKGQAKEATQAAEIAAAAAEVVASQVASNSASPSGPPTLLSTGDKDLAPASPRGGALMAPGSARNGGGSIRTGVLPRTGPGGVVTTATFSAKSTAPVSPMATTRASNGASPSRAPVLYTGRRPAGVPGVVAAGVAGGVAARPMPMMPPPTASRVGAGPAVVLPGAMVKAAAPVVVAQPRVGANPVSPQ